MLRRVFYCFVFAIMVVSQISGENPPVAECQHQQLQQLLLEMVQLDQELRLKWLESTDKNFEEIEKLDQFNAEMLKAIIAQFGWPGYRLVGEEGSYAMWLLVQHTPDLSFQNECLLLLEAAVAQHDASPICLAYLTDRVLVREGKKQLYGTQCRFDEGKLVFYPIEDPEHVNERRKALGMPSWEEYVKEITEIYNHAGSVS